MSVLPKKPEIVIFAGPNGSGKSTITELLKPPMDYINIVEKSEGKRLFYTLLLCSYC